MGRGLSGLEKVELPRARAHWTLLFSPQVPNLLKPVCIRVAGSELGIGGGGGGRARAGIEVGSEGEPILYRLP